MSNTNRFTKVIAVVLAMAVMSVFSFSSAFAATTSPTEGKESSKKVCTIKGSNSGTYVAYSDNTATLKKVYKKTVRTKIVPNKVRKNGKSYNLTKISANAFNGCKKLRTIKVKSTHLKTVEKGAFKGLNTKKITIYITKKISKKEYKKLKVKFVNAGFKGKICWKKLN